MHVCVIYIYSFFVNLIMHDQKCPSPGKRCETNIDRQFIYKVPFKHKAYSECFFFEPAFYITMSQIPPSEGLN